MSGIKLLREYEVKFGLLIVVSKDTLAYPDDLFNWIVGNQFERLDLLPCFEPESIANESDTLSPPSDQLSVFLKQMFDLWWKHDDPQIKVRTFRDVLRYYLGVKPGVCSWQGNCSWILSVDETGNVFPCARFNGYPETSVGNITSRSLDNLLSDKRYKSLRERMLEGQHECQSCVWLPACGGGCPFARYALNQGNFGGPYYFCETRKKLFAHIGQRMGHRRRIQLPVAT